MNRAHDSGWPAFWQSRSLGAILLLPLAALFGLLSGLRRQLYKLQLLPSWRAPVPVLVVGNVTVGGTGKTPLLLLLAQQLVEAGYHPGILSRGWGRAERTVLAVEADTDPRRCGDEPLLLRQRSACPVWVGAKRAQVAQALLAAHPEVDVLLSDDGLQHLALARDLELVVIDQRGAGNGWLLPAGPLRERWHRRRDATLGPASALDRLPGACFALTRAAAALRHMASGRRLSPQDFLRQQAGSRLAAAAGIGHPGQFFQMLRELGCQLEQTLALPDHCPMSGDPFAGLSAECLLITEKDGLKCTPQTPGFERLWVVELELRTDPELLPWLLLQLPQPRTEFHGSTPA